MKEYTCKNCNSPIKVSYATNKNGEEIPKGKCTKCRREYSNLVVAFENHKVWERDVIRHCPNCGKEFETNYGDPGPGYGLQTHTCQRCGWLVGWQHTFSHGEYLVAMESTELWDQRQYFWSQLRKYGRPDAAGDGEYPG